MILHWNSLEHYYGAQITPHRQHFDSPGQSTFGLLCCRFADEHTRLAPSQGDHSEERLLQSPLWQQIETAVRNWVSYSNDAARRAVVTLAINRSPCHSRCVPALFDALNRLQSSYSRRFLSNWRFLLACRGAYRGQVSASGYYEEATTALDLRRLESAGWELCVLQTSMPPAGETLDLGEGLPPSGGELLQSLMHVRGVSTPGLVHLSG